MNKFSKKNPYQLKFDTSKNNLECFIKKKSLSMMENDKVDRKHKYQKLKNKSMSKKSQQPQEEKPFIKRPPEFQHEKLISSIIKSVMSEEFQNIQQVSELLNKVQIQTQEKHESPTHDYLLKIFENTEIRTTPDIKSYSLDLKHIDKKNEEISKQTSIEKIEWQNFSTQMGTDVDTQRSKKEQETTFSIIENSHSPQNIHQQFYQTNLLAGYYHFSLINNSKDYLITKDHPYRKSTPIRGMNPQFKIIIDNIEKDQRTTVMIRHIPNKYTQQMLIDQININHKLKYNFFYLPLDSYHPCNVGYAFINFIDAKFIKKFYLEFNGKRWAKFNSQKICQLAYARIQGSTALINHFQNSNVLNSRDKKVRPFISFGDNHSNNR